MKSKITRGAGFCGLVDYVFDIGKDASHDKDARQIGGNMAGDGNPRVLVAEFAALRRLRPDIERPVWHSSLRLPSGEILSDDKWNEIAQDYMMRLGMPTDNHPYIVVMHNDSHVHIVSSRIRYDGSLYYGRNEHLIATRVTQQLEKDYGLIVTKGPAYGENGKIVRSDKAKLTSNELKMVERTGGTAPRQRLQEIITQAIKDGPTQAEFEKRLTEAGVSYRLASNGYSYQLGGIAFKGSQLGNTFKWAKLQKFLILPEQEIKNKQTTIKTAKGESLNSLNKQQQAVYVAKAAAWEAERKRRDSYRSNRSIIYSIGKLSASVLPRPLGEVVQIAADTLVYISKINDWMRANSYRQEIARLTVRMNRIKADCEKTAAKSVFQKCVLNQNISTPQQPPLVNYDPNATSAVLYSIAPRFKNFEKRAKCYKLAAEVEKLPPGTIIYKGPMEPNLVDLCNAAVDIVIDRRRQERQIHTVAAGDVVTGSSNQVVTDHSHTDQVSCNDSIKPTPRGRRR